MTNGISDALAVLEHVSLRYGSDNVLDDVSLGVSRGEIVTLIGPNGAGKSTVLRVLLGLVRPDSGKAALRPGIRVGYVPQRLAIDPTLPLDVRGFLALARDRWSRLHGFHPQAALAEVRAEGLLDRAVQSLSGGELQRVLLARALLREPDLLVLDEPAQGVDVAGQVEFFSLLGKVRDHRDCGVLVVSHDLHLVMAAADRVICLDRSIQCAGSPAAVSRDLAYQTLFGPAAAALARYARQAD